MEVGKEPFERYQSAVDELSRSAVLVAQREGDANTRRQFLGAINEVVEAQGAAARWSRDLHESLISTKGSIVLLLPGPVPQLSQEADGSPDTDFQSSIDLEDLVGVYTESPGGHSGLEEPGIFLMPGGLFYQPSQRGGYTGAKRAGQLVLGSSGLELSGFVHEWWDSGPPFEKYGRFHVDVRLGSEDIIEDFPTDATVLHLAPGSPAYWWMCLRRFLGMPESVMSEKEIIGWVVPLANLPVHFRRVLAPELPMTEDAIASWVERWIAHWNIR